MKLIYPNFIWATEKYLKFCGTAEVALVIILAYLHFERLEGNCTIERWVEKWSRFGMSV